LRVLLKNALFCGGGCRNGDKDVAVSTAIKPQKGARHVGAPYQGSQESLSAHYSKRHFRVNAARHLWQQSGGYREAILE